MVATRLRLARLCQSLRAIQAFETELASEEESTGQVKPRSHTARYEVCVSSSYYMPYMHYVSNRIFHIHNSLTI